MMPSLTENVFALWMWPLHAARLASDAAGTATAAQRVIAARLPTIADAFRNPFTADHVELGRMVSEKVSAFAKSGKSLGAAGEIFQRASSANARALGKIAGGGFLWPTDWMQLAEQNIAAAATLAALPAATLAPLHKGVTANDMRLRR